MLPPTIEKDLRDDAAAMQRVNPISMTNGSHPFDVCVCLCCIAELSASIVVAKCVWFDGYVGFPLASHLTSIYSPVDCIGMRAYVIGSPVRNSVC